MSTISGAAPVAQPIQTTRVGGTDADGDNDGTKASAAKAPATPAPVVSKPTETLGNNVNTFA